MPQRNVFERRSETPPTRGQPPASTPEPALTSGTWVITRSPRVRVLSLFRPTHAPEVGHLASRYAQDKVWQAGRPAHAPEPMAPDDIPMKGGELNG